MERLAHRVGLCLVSGIAVGLAACGGGSGGNGGGGNPPATPTVTVTPAKNSISTADSLSVTVTVTGTSSTPTGSVTLTSGTYSSGAANLSKGSATINIAAGKLATGSDSLSASYTPDAGSSATYGSASGTATVAVTQAMATVTVSPAFSTIGTGQALNVTVTVAGPAGGAMPTGSVTLTSRGYTSAATNLTNGSATISIPAGSLATGSATLTASYTPDTASTGIYGGATGSANVTVDNQSTPTVTVSPELESLSIARSLNVTVNVNGPSGSPAPTGSVVLSSGDYTSSPAALSSGSATIAVPGYSLVYGSDTLNAAYSPDTQSTGIFNSSSGTATVSVAKAAPTVTVTPAALTIGPNESLNVTVAVAGPGTGAPAASGTVSLTGGGYTSPSPVALSGGSASITIAAGVLITGNDTLTASYTPDSASASIYSSTTGVSAAVNVVLTTTVSVTQGVSVGTVTDQLLGMNLATWYDVITNANAINTAFGQAGIKAIRWPGGSWSDTYHWGWNKTNLAPYTCNTNNTPATPDGWGGWATFPQFVSSIAQAGKFDLALTANYGSNETCTGGGDPAEAAAWAAEAVKEGYPASHMTVGNENYGSWEYDLHAKQWDAGTYAAAVVGAGGFYNSIKTASSSTLVGVVVDADNTAGGWDSTVLANAKGSYDFVEFHFYPQAPGSESDTYLVHQAPLDLTKSVITVKSELAAAGVNVPIYVGELGSVYTAPGKQSWSITQGLYAGQVLGEMMNAGVSRLTWWIGFGNCDEDSKGNPLGNMSASLYGWQTFGAYNVFSDGPTDGPCGVGSGAIGTMSPTARAFQLFSNIAESGANHPEEVLKTSLTGDTANVRAYAATNNGGTALFLFNLNENQNQPVTITLSIETVSSSDVKVITYDKSIYDQTNAATPVWADPTTVDMGTQTLPLKLTLTPWSMNVVIIK
jgi:hypothetical protein